ncbi:MAG: hypothetical protein E7206_14295 [Clostridium beijerinckii]|nr:hypothetical protein [Clostridium beijerinckii]
MNKSYNILIYSYVSNGNT